ncbi:cysteine--tRNA ligase [Methanobrevibacter filiformis]|uniref:Cysteine--tRNA ligase n=1 Tax=Methanobrevibacter filiformis TaxID=55758 RepID=A0A166FEA0_9EURY|nr:cysteine--tRNA ligase [Methanobrevibacter filiformis]KZX17584.1 cysteine--tRNA ligase [Methanobrevibacter filiformis]
MLEIYNTLKRDKELFNSENDSKINLFVCGPTVYDDAHIGHGRTYISFDLIKRYLEYTGYSVFYMENITDIDDKIINRAKERNIPFNDLSGVYEKRFREDMEKLNANSVNLYPRATEHLKEIFNQIDELMDKGFAYEIDDGIYFDVLKFPDFGKLSNQNLEMLDSHRIDVNDNKRDPKDFALWKKTEEEPYFKSKWGNGRPGWHIEDTAITEYYFGSQYDIHGGGLDLIFPHHEAEIAQMEAISGKMPMVKYWMHTGFLNVDGVKMSKSLGNFITIRELLENWDPMAFRLFVLSTHYRSPIDFSEKSLHQASKNLQRLKTTVNSLIEFREYLIAKYAYDSLDNDCNNGSSDDNNLNVEILNKLVEMENSFFESMDDDFNTPKALSIILNFTKMINGFINQEKKILDNTNDIVIENLKIPYEFVIKSLEFFDAFERIFKLNLFEKEEIPDISSDVLDLLLDVREKLRNEKNYELSDYIRDKLNELNINIEDN